MPRSRHGVSTNVEQATAPAQNDSFAPAVGGVVAADELDLFGQNAVVDVLDAHLARPHVAAGHVQLPHARQRQLAKVPVLHPCNHTVTQADGGNYNRGEGESVAGSGCCHTPSRHTTKLGVDNPSPPLKPF